MSSNFRLHPAAKRIQLLELADLIEQGATRPKRFTNRQWLLHLHDAESRVLGYAIDFRLSKLPLDELQLLRQIYATRGRRGARVQSVNRFFGLTDAEGQELFFPVYPGYAHYCSQPSQSGYISHCKAVSVVRHFARVGVLDWNIYNAAEVNDG